MMRHMSDPLFVALAVGQVADHADEILRYAVGAIHEQARRGDNAGAVAGRGHRVFVEKNDFSGLDQFTVFRLDLFGGRLRHDLNHSLAKHLVAVDAEKSLGGAVY